MTAAGDGAVDQRSSRSHNSKVEQYRGSHDLDGGSEKAEQVSHTSEKTRGPLS